MTPLIEIDAGEFARAWLDTAVAIPHNTGYGCDGLVSLEVYEYGLTLTATDSRTIVTTWASQYGDERPGHDERPDSTWVVSDHDNRMRDLMKYAKKVVARAVKNEATERSTLDLTVISAEADDIPTLHATMDRQALQVTFADEILTLPIVDVAYPNWRTILSAPLGSSPTKAPLVIPTAAMKQMGALSSTDLVWHAAVQSPNGQLIRISGGNGTLAALVVTTVEG